jgi:phage-related protein
MPDGAFKRQWRPYKTASGRNPVEDYIDTLSDQDAAEIVAAMKRVARDGLSAARHLRGSIYEVRVDGFDQIYRILFAPLGRYQQVFLSLEGFSKKTRKTPVAKIGIAERRLRDWLNRGNM